MKKGDLIVNINNTPESIAHAHTLGYVPVNGTLKIEPSAKQPTSTGVPSNPQGKPDTKPETKPEKAEV